MSTQESREAFEIGIIPDYDETFKTRGDTNKISKRTER